MTAKKYLFTRVWIWTVIIVVAFAIWGFAFYWISLPSSDKTLQVWVGSTEWLTDKVENDIIELSDSYGMEKCTIGTYNPTDSMYAQAFATRATSIDIFILNKDEALAIATANLFREISVDGDTLNFEEKIIGVNVGDDMYLLIGANSHKNDTLIEAILEYFTK